MANRKRVFALLALCFALAGCELVADFDRDKIPLPDGGRPVTPDAGTPDGATPDAMLPIPGMDAAAPDEDAGAGDVDVDAGAGSTADAGFSADAGP